MEEFKPITLCDFLGIPRDSFGEFLKERDAKISNLEEYIKQLEYHEQKVAELELKIIEIQQLLA